MVHLSNHHCHTLFSDGKTSPESFVKKALEENLVSLGFSDHAPIPNPGLTGMKAEALPDYQQVIARLRDTARDHLQIYKGLEVDYIPGVISVNSTHIVNANPDFTIGAVHYVDQFDDGTYWNFESGFRQFQRGVDEIFNGDIVVAVKRYYTLIREMVNDHRPDVVAHLDRIKKLNRRDRYFNENEKWYREEVIETLQAIARNKCILEVNTKGYYSGDSDDTYPSKWILEIANQLEIPVHLASDAHHPDHLRSGFDFGLKQLKAIGYKNTFVMLDHCWQDSNLIENRIYIF
jgi:histidinol-phosphatase (PHP family)